MFTLHISVKNNNFMPKNEEKNSTTCFPTLLHILHDIRVFFKLRFFGSLVEASIVEKPASYMYHTHTLIYHTPIVPASFHTHLSIMPKFYYNTNKIPR